MWTGRMSKDTAAFVTPLLAIYIAAAVCVAITIFLLIFK